MNNRQTVARLLLGILVLAIPVAASAQDRGLYVGVDMGVASLPENSRLNVGNVLLEDAGSDADGFTFGVTAGYRFSRYFAVEAGYVDLGDTTISLADPSGANAGQGAVNYSATGATAAVIGMLPFGSRWESTLKLGVIFPDYDISLDGTAGGSPFHVRFGTDKARFFGGLSLRYHLTERWQLKVGIDHYSKVGDRVSTGGGALRSEADITTLNFGAVFKF
jgi:hypothetical protein